jgi:hypothetical protein
LTQQVAGMYQHQRGRVEVTLTEVTP